MNVISTPDGKTEFKECSDQHHAYSKSSFPREKVPLDHFTTKQIGKYYKTCVDCRNYQKKVRYVIEEVTDPNYGYCPHAYHDDVSIHPRNEVPIELFAANQKGSNVLLQTCKDCRNQVKKSKAEKHLIRLESLEETEFCCGRCSHIFLKTQRAKNMDGSDSIVCIPCKILDLIKNKTIAELHKQFKTNLIFKLNFCCEVCENIVLIEDKKAVYVPTERGEDGVYVIQPDEEPILATDFIEENKDKLALCFLEYDHLPENEQRDTGRLKDGEPFEEKKGCVSGMRTELSIRREAAKCQLVCTKCHILETMRRESGAPQFGLLKQDKGEYVINLKKSGCVVCNDINEAIPRFYEFDHIDPTIKNNQISQMVSDHAVSLEELIEECEKCRILCRNCHILHTKEQRENAAIERMLQLKAALESCN